MSRPVRHPGGMFSGASNTAVYDGMFTQVHGNYYHQHGQPQDAGLTSLSQAISHGATHDSAQRYPAGKCHPGTREEIIKTILEWINNPNPSSDALWLYGPAGAGKSAIMQTIAELLRELYKERYAGSFFFTSGKPGCDQGSALFSTLAYQIAIYVPGMREAVNNAMIADITLPTKSMEVQIQYLIVEPFKRCQFPPAHTPTILIDGLDECQGSDTQRAILKLIANAKTAAGVPLRFLIASRPEFWIRDEFDRQPLFDITQRLELTDSRQASLDIKKYLDDGFAEIYDKNLDVMAGVQRPWPPTKIIDRLVSDACGQFVYASTILKFVGAEFCDPRIQLDIISTPGPLRASAFSDLDRLYTKILSAYPRRASLIRVLEGLLVGAHPATIEKCFGVERGELNMVLRATSSLLEREEEVTVDQDEDLELIYGRKTPNISLCHQSFRDYLMDGNRSGEFAINHQVVIDELFNHLLDLIINGLIGVQKHRNPPVVYDDMWDPLLDPYFFEDASLTIIEKRVSDLLVAMQTFTGDGNRMATHPNWKCILCHLSYAERVMHSVIQRNDYSILNDVWLEMEALTNECFRQILSSSNFLKFENVPYFVKADDFFSHGCALAELAEILGVSEALGKMFLIDNAHLVAVSFEKKNSAFKSPIYRPRRGLLYFLKTASHGGVFHIEFRKKFIRLGQQALAFLNTPLDLLLLSGVNIPPLQDLQHLAKFIVGFLACRDISDVKFMEDQEDNHNMQAFIETLCTGDNWKSLISPANRFLRHECVIFEWLHRQLNQDPAPSSLAYFREGMVQMIDQICEQRILPKFTIPYFSDNFHAEETWLSSVTFPPLDHGLQKKYLASENTIPPYNIQHSSLYDNYRLDVIEASSKITAIVEKFSSIDRVKCYTHFLEHHLLAHATYFHRSIDRDYSIRTFSGYDGYGLKYFAQWFSYAYPSTKILVGLWTSCYLLRRVKAKWYPPAGFCSGAISYLEKYSLDPTGGLHLWLGDLTECSTNLDSDDFEDSDSHSEDEQEADMGES